MDIALWSGLEDMASVAVRTAAVYLLTVAAVRVAGRRTLAQMSAFDILVTVAIGTLAASTVLPSSPALSEFAAALLTFLVLQVFLGALRQRFKAVERLLDFQPTAVFHDGRVDLPRAPWTAQLTRSDLESRLRQKGLGALEEATVVVLESTGETSVTTDAQPPKLFRRFGRQDARQPGAKGYGSTRPRRMA